MIKSITESYQLGMVGFNIIYVLAVRELTDDCSDVTQ